MFLVVGFIALIPLGLIPVDESIEADRLYEFTQTKIDDLHDTGVWSHDSSNRTWDERAEDYGVEGYLGEVLYVGNSCDVRIAFAMWEQSATHKEVLDHYYEKGVLLIEKRGDLCYIVFNVEDY